MILLRIKQITYIFLSSLLICCPKCGQTNPTNLTQIDSNFLRTNPNLDPGDPTRPKIGFKSGIRVYKYNIHYWVELEFGTFLRSAWPDLTCFLTLCPNQTQQLDQPSQVSLKIWSGLPALVLSKGVFFQKVRFFFPNLPISKKHIPKNYPELEI